MPVFYRKINLDCVKYINIMFDLSLDGDIESHTNIFQ